MTLLAMLAGCFISKFTTRVAMVSVMAGEGVAEEKGRYSGGEGEGEE